MIGIVDYNAGNIRSVEHALSSLGFEYVISNNPDAIDKADRIIFPGVGDANYAMNQLSQTGFDIFLKQSAKEGKPILGICLGSQIIFDHSSEGDTKCLGLIPGNIVHLQNLIDSSKIPAAKNSIKIPHMGWNNITFTKPCALFDGVPENTDFYFVHSYVIQPHDQNDIAAYADYCGLKIPAAIQHKNIYAMQFHPEKSAPCGLQILKNFCTKGNLGC